MTKVKEVDMLFFTLTICVKEFLLFSSNSPVVYMEKIVRWSLKVSKGEKTLDFPDPDFERTPSFYQYTCNRITNEYFHWKNTNFIMNKDTYRIGRNTLK